MNCPSPVKVVGEAVDVARAAAVAASEACCMAITVEKEASAAVQYVAIAVEKVEAVKTSTTLVNILKLFDFHGGPQLCAGDFCRLENNSNITKLNWITGPLDTY